MFGPANPELLPGARNAIETCLAVESNERVALIADEASKEVAASLESALNGHSWQGYLLEECAARPLSDVPSPVTQALEACDVGILCMRPQEGELRARMEMVRIVERRQIRYAHMVG